MGEDLGGSREPVAADQPCGGADLVPHVSGVGLDGTCVGNGDCVRIVDEMSKYFNSTSPYRFLLTVLLRTSKPTNAAYSFCCWLNGTRHTAKAVRRNAPRLSNTAASFGRERRAMPLPPPTIITTKQRRSRREGEARPPSCSTSGRSPLTSRSRLCRHRVAVGEATATAKVAAVACFLRWTGERTPLLPRYLHHCYAARHEEEQVKAHPSPPGSPLLLQAPFESCRR
nr:hypothetical protein Iba_chr01aCG3590 [Ipomoea batatas]